MLVVTIRAVRSVHTIFQLLHLTQRVIVCGADKGDQKVFDGAEKLVQDYFVSSISNSYQWVLGINGAGNPSNV